MVFPEIERPSPNFGTGANERLGVLFHHSELPFGATIARMQDPASQVSYHCLIGLDGTRCTLVPDSGVAFEGDTARDPLTGPQLSSALEWLEARWGPLGWNLGRMTDHRQVSPGRKRDLCPPEWARLAAAIAAHFGDPGP